MRATCKGDPDRLPRPLPLLHGLFDFLLNLVEVDVQILKDRGSYALTLADESEQDVLGANVLVLEPLSFLSRHGENLSDSLSEVVPVHLAISAWEREPAVRPALLFRSLRRPASRARTVLSRRSPRSR